MNNQNEFFNNGLKYAIKETYANVHEIKSKLEKIKNEQGEEASKEFLNGYYKGLMFFTHAIDKAQCNDNTIEERAIKIEELYGEDAKKAFLMGINYYKDLNEEKKSKTNK